MQSPEQTQFPPFNAQTRLRRADTTRGSAGGAASQVPLRILSLDGGGVRGYSMFVILENLMHKAFLETEGRPPKVEEIPKPAEYFDLIGGTGTGGLIAIMLGRLRLDLETCKDVYTRMTRKVFETDKTIAGIPYRNTLYKASKLEEAIKACVREHTTNEREGNDKFAGTNPPMSPAGSMRSESDKRRSTVSLAGLRSEPFSPSGFAPRYTAFGSENALLYDLRENRTKTAVTAVYKGTSVRSSSSTSYTGAVLLRSYDSRKEPPPETNCTIWQAARATSAIALAFKPISIGQSTFLDEGAGKYNPAPQLLDEACMNEWPDREVGVFYSIGTGKRPRDSRAQHEWWEDFIGGAIGEFADAKRRLVTKIEGCETTHEFMRDEYLSRRGVDPNNYYRLNVEIGVGEFGMNEWNRLSEISTNTRRYLSRTEVERAQDDAARKLGQIERAKRERTSYSTVAEIGGEEATLPGLFDQSTRQVMYELPVDEEHSHRQQQYSVESPTSIPNPSTAKRYYRQASMGDKFSVLSDSDTPTPIPPRNGTYPLNQRNSLNVPQGRSATYSHSYTDPSSSAYELGLGSASSGYIPPPRRSHELPSSPSIHNLHEGEVDIPAPLHIRHHTQTQSLDPQSQESLPPPIPPKTPLTPTNFAVEHINQRLKNVPPLSTSTSTNQQRPPPLSYGYGAGHVTQTPYPLDDEEEDEGPLPSVNLATKPVRLH